MEDPELVQEDPDPVPVEPEPVPVEPKPAPVKSEPVTETPNESKPASMNKLNEFMATLRITHSRNLSEIMDNYPLEFAGDYYPDDHGGRRHLGDELPVYLLPMCAPFDDAYGSDFTSKLNRFKHYVKERRNRGECDGSPFAIIYVRSPGGDVAVLKRILLSLELGRRDLSIRYIISVKYGYSCGFILAMAGCIVVSNGDILCHEPSQSQGGAAPSTTQSATVTAVELRLTQDEIYDHAELGILLRFISKNTEHNVKKWINQSDVLLHVLVENKTILRKWRTLWYKTHGETARRMHEELFPGERLGEGSFHEDNNILKWITGSVAGNRHEFMITPKYQLMLDLVDAIDADFELAETEHVQLSKDEMTSVIGSNMA